MFKRRLLTMMVCTLIVAGMTTGLAFGQATTTFSIDYQGPTRGLPDGFLGGGFISEGDILTPLLPGPPGPNPPGAPAAPPGQMLTPAALGIFPTAAGHVELDALSYGRDTFNWGLPEVIWYFSVDEFAAGHPLDAFPPPPANVLSEGADPLLGNMEASADVFTTAPAPFGAPRGPGPFGAGDGNFAWADGDAVFPWGGPGMGLIEPNAPTYGAVLDDGDNLDALDIHTTFADVHGGPLPATIFFSLDAEFPDPFEVPAAPPPNTGTAAANGFVGGDVLVSVGGAPFLFAPAALLGLDMFGADTDDLDALALIEDGDGVFEPWGDDLIFYSVRRGSAVIGFPDAIWGAPIEEGDILVPPAVAGGPPGIWVAAERLGLATVRSGTALVPPPGYFARGDDLNALDIAPEPASLSLLALGGLALLRRRP